MDQMVLVMARREAGPCQRQPKALKGELGNNSRKPSQKIGIVTGLKWFNLLYIRVRRRREMKLLMVKMMMMQCVTRTSGSNTLCPEELFLSTQYIFIALRVYPMVNMWGGGDTDG